MRLSCLCPTFLASVLLLSGCVLSLDNGLALSPPMGWISWVHFGCNTNCATDPTNCLNEANIRAIADHMVSAGFKAVGYQYVVIDDCWLARRRGPDGRQMPDPDRFPSGMKALADYIHGKGLKFGIYTDIGVRTCAGYPASQFFLERDASTFAEWGVDYVKVDGCNAETSTMREGFDAFGLFLNLTQRPILYSCEWPAYELSMLTKPNYTAVRAACNTWRTFLDMAPSWDGVFRVLAFWAADAFNISRFAGPGGWNDPDVLVVGNAAISPDQETVQMAAWAMMAAPLMMSADLRAISPASVRLLQHRGLLRISQDPLGRQGTVAKLSGMLQFWRRPLHPVPATFALAVINADPTDAATVTACLADFGVAPGRAVGLWDVLEMRQICANCTCADLRLAPTSAAVLMTQ